MVIELDFVDLFLAAGSIAIAILLSVWHKMGLEANILLAAARAFLQLLVLGAVVEFAFAWETPIAAIILLLVLVTVAAILARNRIGGKVPFLFAIVWVSIAIATAISLAYTFLFVLRDRAMLDDPKYAIAIGSILIASATSSVTLAGERFATSVRNNTAEIETYLCLGASPQQATTRYRREALRIGIIPVIRAAAIVGLARLPELMAGEILAGVSPLMSAAYQIVVAFAAIVSAMLAPIIAIAGMQRQFFNAAEQLCYPK